MITLRSQIEVFARFLADGTTAFVGDHCGQVPTSVALYSSPVNGWISLCVDTVDRGSGPLTSCPNFSHPEYRLIEFPEWIEEYNADHPTIQRHDSVVVKIKSTDGDEVFNEPFYLSLMRASNDHYHHGNQVFRPIWAGVQILDSEFSSFWRVRKGAELA